MTLTEDTLFLYNNVEYKRCTSLIDIGCGTGEALKEFAATHPDCSFTGIDIQTNQTKTGNLQLLKGDINEVRTLFQPHSFDVMISNPPYFSKGSGILPEDQDRLQERFQISMDLKTLLSAVAYLIKPNGEFYLLSPAKRLFEVLDCANRHNLKIYDLRFRHNAVNRDSDLCLFHGKNRKGEMVPEIRFPFLNYQEDL